MRNMRMTSAIVGGLLLAMAAQAGAVTLPSVFGDNMVLQRGKPLPIWGWAEPGERITVSLDLQKVTTQAGADGKWKVTLHAMYAGGPYVLSVSGRETKTFKNILIGEVWICSGQSNMEWSVAKSNNAKAEIAAAGYPKIRLIHIPRTISSKPLDNANAKWVECSSQTVQKFTAVGYFFGRKLHKELGVPVGLIGTSWGGTRIEPWTPPAGLKIDGKFTGLIDKLEQQRDEYRQAQIAAIEKMSTWAEAARKAATAGKAISSPPAWPREPLNNRVPTALYNGMIHPLVPFAIRGAIWYQGESNLREGMLYHGRMKALIGGWRKVWGQGDFPFYFVQLAPFRYNASPTLLPEIWEAQTASLAIPNTGMAVTHDIGNVKDIHPKNKQDVGARLALWALARDYGRESLVYSGPLYKVMKIEGSKIRITFNHTGSGLASYGDKPLTWFTIAGRDRKFFSAKATIDGHTVVVELERVPKPEAVRFAWHQEAAPNLSNQEGLPASPFRTDSWKNATMEKN